MSFVTTLPSLIIWSKIVSFLVVSSSSILDVKVLVVLKPFFVVQNITSVVSTLFGSYQYVFAVYFQMVQDLIIQNENDYLINR